MRSARGCNIFTAAVGLFPWPVLVTATFLGIPGDAVAVLLGVVMFLVLLLLLEGVDRV
ncbi:MAG: hypothetical protein ACR2KV_08580 [Solirubrobacteraceae bacterium]